MTRLFVKVRVQCGFFGRKLSVATKPYPVSQFVKQANFVKIYSMVELDFSDVQFIKTVIRVVNYCPMVQYNSQNKHTNYAYLSSKQFRRETEHQT